MSKNLLIPSCIAAMVVTGGFAAFATFSYNKGVEADRYYTAQASALQNTTMNTIALSLKASRDASFTGQMEQASSQATAFVNALQNGNSIAGIAPLPAASAANLYAFEEAWRNVIRAVDQIAASRDNNSAFSRQAEEARKLATDLVRQATEAVTRVNNSPQVSERIKSALVDSLQNLVEGSELVVSGADANTDTLRIAQVAASSFVSTVGQVGNAMPRDNDLVQPLLTSYRTAQNFQRIALRAIESASGQVDNAPAAQMIWAEKANLDTALNGLMHSINTMPQTRPITPMIMLGSIALALLCVLLGVALILREARARTRQAESMGSTIQTSQKERSKELHQLFDEMEMVRQGDLTVEFTPGLPSTNEIATTLNSVFMQFRGIVKDVQQTIVSLSAASEQTLTMAKNVNRNRQEQDRAINHIAKLVDDLKMFTQNTDNLSIRTKDTSQQVTEQIKAGSKAVQEVHEGVIKLSQSNMNIMHHTKGMTENIQGLERMVDVVRRVANQSATVAYNAFLVADAIGDDELSKRIRVSADAMQQLTSSANEAAEQIATSLRGINDAAKDTQVVLDDSQKEIKELTVRSNNALTSLGTIRDQSTQLAESIISVTEQTSQLKTRSEQVGETMTSIHHYASEHSAASEQTASAINNLNTQAQRVGETLAHFKV